MAITIKRDGYGQVEPNHLSAPRDGRVYAQLPAAEDIEILENGMFVKYDYAAGEVNFTGDGAWMLVYNEEKLYDERHQMHKDWAQKVEDSYDGKIYPRVFGIVAGDIFTTNTFENNTELAVGDDVTPGEDGFLAAVDTEAEDAPTLVFRVVKEYTLPDGQPAVKLQCIKA